MIAGALAWQAVVSCVRAAGRCLAATQSEVLAATRGDDAPRARAIAFAALDILRAHCRAGDDIVLVVPFTPQHATAAIAIRALAYPVRVFDPSEYGNPRLKPGARCLVLALDGAEPPKGATAVLREVARVADAVLWQVERDSRQSTNK